MRKTATGEPGTLPLSDSRDSAAPLSLLVLSDAGVQELPLPSRGLLIGRGEGCDVVVPNESVSRRHVRVIGGPEPRVDALESMNGTRVGDELIAPGESRRIAPGTVIQIGTVTIVLRDGRHRASSAPRTRAARDGSADIVVADPAMKELYALVDVIAPSTISVLLLGETGVGKEVFAATIHARSQRADGPFLQLNCAALPESTLESELFGHERGAFTGAVAQKNGLLESADGGTVFLDEIGEMAPTTQSKLLRVLENGEVTRLGGLRARKIDLRVLSATNKDLTDAMRTGAFRQDLFFRLNGISLTLPPLRKRPDDLLPLAELFMRRAAASLGKAARLAPEAEALLASQRWPGNVRELKNVIGRATLLCKDGVIRPEHLQLVASPADGDDARAAPSRSEKGALSGEPARDLPGDVGAYERQRIIQALDQCAGNQSSAAKVLGITRRALVYRLDLYGITRPRKGRDG